MGVRAILDAVDADSVGVWVGETNPEVAYAEAVFRRLDALEPLYVSGVGRNESLESGGDPQAGQAVQAVEIGPGLIGEDELLQEGSLKFVTSSMVKPRSATTCSKGIPLLCLNHSRPTSMSRTSSSVTGSSSISAAAKARSKGSSRTSKRRVSQEPAARSCRGRAASVVACVRCPWWLSFRLLEFGLRMTTLSG